MSPIITISPRIYIVGGRDLSHILDSNVYLVKVNDFYILIDVGTGLGFYNLLRNLLELNIRIEDIRYIFLTHAHFHAAGGAYMFNSLPGLIVAHEPDSSYLRSLDLRKMSVNEEYSSYMYPVFTSISIPLNKTIYKLSENILVVHTPGHTKGSISVLVDSVKALFVGDLTSGILSKDWDSSLEDYYSSLNKVIELVDEHDISILCSSYNCIRGKQGIIDLLRNSLHKEPIWV